MYTLLYTYALTASARLLWHTQAYHQLTFAKVDGAVAVSWLRFLRAAKDYGVSSAIACKLQNGMHCVERQCLFVLQGVDRKVPGCRRLVDQPILGPRGVRADSSAQAAAAKKGHLSGPTCP